MKNKLVQELCMHSIPKMKRGRKKNKQNKIDKPTSQVQLPK